jgi:phospholipid/cholesterol/gamma-HCH transport system substrate-binding protein
LRRTAPSVLSAVAALREVAPTATETLRSGSAAVPSLRALLQQGAPFAEQLRTVLDQAKPIMGCIRPYAPELASLVSTWAGFSPEYDANGNYARALVTALPFGAGEKRTSKQIVDESGGTVGYGFPTPPGSIAGQPWYQPQCGAGRNGLDPAHDPEAKP